MTFNPKVSIIIPVYNGQKYLKEAIDSALAQTYKNIEIIVVNDGSRDNGASEKIALAYGSKIRYFYKENGWVASALNYGIKKMTGEYFSWLSHDDAYYPNKIEDQIEFISKQKNKNIIVFSDYDLMDERSEVYANIKVREFPSNKFKLELIQASPISGCTLLIPKSLFAKSGLFDEKIRTAQDYDLWFKLANHAKFTHLKKGLIKSRVHRDQVTEHFSDYMIEESEQLYTREVINLFNKGHSKDYSADEMVKCARGLIQKYCFKSAFKVLRLVKIKNLNLKAIKQLLLFMFDYSFYTAVLLKHEIFPIKPKPTSAVLIVTPGFLPILGGMENQVYSVARELISRRYLVDVVTEQSLKSLPKFEQIDGIKVYRLSKPNRKFFLGYLGFIFTLSIFLIRNQKKYNFIIIRTFTVQGLTAGFLKFTKLLRRPTLITCDTGGENDELDLILHSRLRKMYKFFFSQHDHLNALCDSNLSKLSELNFAEEKITKIYNGLIVNQYNNSNYPNGVNNFLFLGQLLKTKGLYELLEAMEKISVKYPKTKLIIAGDGPEKSKILSYIKKNKLEKNIKYLGRITDNQKDSFFSSGECLVLPSYSESFGIVLAEAALYKRYIICTDVGDVKKIYPDAIICQKRSAEDLYEKMEKLLLTEPLNKPNYNHSMSIIDIRNTVNQIINLFI